MPDELLVKLDDLHSTAARVALATARITDAVEAVQPMLMDLHHAGAGSESFVTLYHSTSITNHLESLRRLAVALSQASTDFERAALPHLPPLGRLWEAETQVFTAPIMVEAVPAAVAAVPIIGSYVSRANQPLYQRLAAVRAALADEQTALDSLVITRQQTVQDITALKNRLTSYGETDPDSVPRVAALTAEVARLDDEIEAAGERITGLHTETDQLTTRLLRVSPTDGADLALIRGLEGGSTSVWVQGNTEDCVQHVVSRVAVPDALARNAHLWNDLAVANPQFGVTAGDVPLAGSVLVMEPEHPYADDTWGHLMYVERVDGDDVWVTDNNHPEPVRLADLTTAPTGEHMKYLYLPWHTRA